MRAETNGRKRAKSGITVKATRPQLHQATTADELVQAPERKHYYTKKIIPAKMVNEF